MLAIFNRHSHLVAAAADEQPIDGRSRAKAGDEFDAARIDAERQALRDNKKDDGERDDESRDC